MRVTATDIEGVLVRDLVPHADARGDLTEFFRAEWNSTAKPVQWNCVRSRKNALRGVHVHVRHFDYLAIMQGIVLVGLHDLRSGSASYGRGALIKIDEARPSALEIPPGVAHGFYCIQDATLAYGVSHYWDNNDELGCRWDDPGLRIGWPDIDPILSPRDLGLGTMQQVEAEVNAAMRGELCVSA